MYLSYGLVYNFFNLEYKDYLIQGDNNVLAQIHKVGGEILIGYQFFLYEVVSLDIYSGLGTRVSMMSTTSSSTDKFNDTSFGFNYSGNLLIMGLRLGVKF